MTAALAAAVARNAAAIERLRAKAAALRAAREAERLRVAASTTPQSRRNKGPAQTPSPYTPEERDQERALRRAQRVEKIAQRLRDYRAHLADRGLTTEEQLAVVAAALALTPENQRAIMTRRSCRAAPSEIMSEGARIKAARAKRT